MTTEIAPKMVCVKLRSGIEKWIEEERGLKLQDALQSVTGHKFIRYEQETINTADIEGIFTPETMETFTRLKQGQWKCNTGTWHQRKDDCNCYWENERRSKQEDWRKKMASPS